MNWVYPIKVYNYQAIVQFTDRLWMLKKEYDLMFLKYCFKQHSLCEVGLNYS